MEIHKYSEIHYETEKFYFLLPSADKSQRHSELLYYLNYPVPKGGLEKDMIDDFTLREDYMFVINKMNLSVGFVTLMYNTKVRDVLTTLRVMIKHELRRTPHYFDAMEKLYPFSHPQGQYSSIQSKESYKVRKNHKYYNLYLFHHNATTLFEPNKFILEHAVRFFGYGYVEYCKLNGNEIT